jgi:phenylacetate-CoA ligase
MHRLRHWLDRARRPERFALLDGLLKNQGLSREQVLVKQREDLRQIADFAVQHTDYYRERFGTIWKQEATIGDLPILKKDDVIRHRDDLLVRDADRKQTKIGHTGGSTGKPLAFWYDDAKHELMRAGMCRSYMGSGWQPGQKILNFWGARQDTQAGGVFGETWGDFIAAEKTIPAHEFSESRLAEWARFIGAYRPVLLQGYASILAELARFVVENRLEMPNSLLGVYSTAEVLNGWQRELMERAFGCKVFNQYGSREIPNIGCECRHGKLHVFTDMVYLESLPDGDEDRLIVTSLTNRLMPMIRYDIGDSGRLLDGDCDCGWPFPLMEMGMCRQNDLIRTSSGKSVHPSYFNRLLYGLTLVRQYQFVQTAPDKIVLNLVSSSRLSPETVAAMKNAIRRDVDRDMVFEIIYLEEIPRTVSGKHRFVIGYGGRKN